MWCDMCGQIECGCKWIPEEETLTESSSYLTYEWEDEAEKLLPKSEDDRRLLSVEVECNLFRSTHKRWEQKTDNSVSCDMSHGCFPVEFNTTPSSGEGFRNQVKLLCADLTGAGAHVNKTCGMHVHVDARDLKWKAFKSLISTYHSMEEALFQVVSPSRRNNQYCRSNRHKDPPHSLLKGQRPIDLTLKSYTGSDRYYSLNLESWWRHGTIECRLHQGTTDYRKIIPWAFLFERLVTLSCQGFKASGDPWDVLMEVSPPQYRLWWEIRRAELSK